MKKFEEPIIETIEFAVEDVITASGETGSGPNCTGIVDPFA